MSAHPQVSDCHLFPEDDRSSLTWETDRDEIGTGCKDHQIRTLAVGALGAQGRGCRISVK